MRTRRKKKPVFLGYQAPPPLYHQFTMPNELFWVKPSAGAVAVYSYLRMCEDRKTYQCHPSYSTIGKDLGMSKGTVAKYVRELEDKKLIYTEPTEVRLADGRRHNGNLLFTIRPIEDAVNYYNATEAEKSARDELQRTVAEYRSKDPKTAV